jgi:STE24 endopeptidase
MTLQRALMSAAMLVVCSTPVLARQAPVPPDPEGGQVTEYRLPPDKLERAEGLYRTRNVLLIVDAAYGLALLTLVLSLRVSARFRSFAEQVSRRRFLQAAVFIPLLILTVDVLSLPIGVYRQHLGLEYGLSVQSWPSWVWDWTKSELITLVLSTVLIWGFYGLLRRSPTRWWLWAWLACLPLIVLLVFVTPVLLEPLFNRFEPLVKTQPQLMAPIRSVLARGGVEIPDARMFEMIASEKVTTYNAYVSGIGASRRVVVWDNTARELTIPQTLFVFGHEMGHYVLDHIWKRLAFLSVALLLVFWLAYRTIGWVLARWGERWEVRAVTDWASLPALLLVVSVFTFVVQPGILAFIRYQEHQADIYGLEVIHGLVPESSQVAAQGFQKLGEKAYAYPTPNRFLVFWTYDHPDIASRVRFALDYRPWDRGEPNELVK